MKHLFLLSIFFITYTQAQYIDYVGAGHNDAITVTASSEQSRIDWIETAAASKTVNGDGIDGRLLETSRFLAQATFGTDLAYIKEVSEGTFEEWIDNQFTLSSSSMGSMTAEIYEEALAMFIAEGGDADDYFGPEGSHFKYAWWQTNMNNEDLLRQRVTLALSEILVLSSASDLYNFGDGLGYYYDTLSSNAFGNFEDLLLDVSLHPMMASYLTHYNNPKTIPEYNIYPDENYAREIMQLFSIGLYKLNTDGSYILDDDGERIPTYDNNHIKEFAKIFTGLSASDVIENEWGVIAEFGSEFWFCRKDLPLAMYDEWHEPGEKHLLDGYVVPAGQTGMEDVEETITHLFNHPNVGPFIAKRLIQRLVKSNPSPAYISSVASAFNNTSGVRGDMKAVIKAILLHPEARSCSWVNHPHQGKLREPMLRYFNVTRQMDLDNPSGITWNLGYYFYTQTGQAPLVAPSVFNFFYPNFSPNGEISDAGLIAPEFQIHNSVTSIGYINQVDLWTYPDWGYSMFETWNLGIEEATLDFTALKYYAKDSEVLINQLDKLFTHGLLSDETRALMKDAIDPIIGSDPDIDYMHYRVKMALYLLLISPDYAIIK